MPTKIMFEGVQNKNDLQQQISKTVKWKVHKS